MSSSSDSSGSASASNAPAPTQKAPKLATPVWSHFVAGGAGGMLGAMITSPLEVVKTRLQAGGNKSSLQVKGPFGLRTFYALLYATPSCARELTLATSLRRRQVSFNLFYLKRRFSSLCSPIFTSPSELHALFSGSFAHHLHPMLVFAPSYSQLRREETIRGFYRGLGPHLLGVIPSRAISFFAYGNTKDFLCNKFNMAKDSAVSSMIAGVSAGFVVVTTTQPIWLVKTRMQLQSVQGNMLYKNSFHAVQRIYNEEGFRVLYRGMTASYVGISESTFQFVLYERFKSLVQGYTGRELDIPEYLAVASTAKLIAAASTYPHEVIRTRMRETGTGSIYQGVFSGLGLIYRNEGIRGLYGGMAAHLIRVVPNAAIMFLTYETVLRFLSKPRS